MSYLKANFGRGIGRDRSSPQGQLVLDAAKLPGSIVVFKRGKDFVVE